MPYERSLLLSVSRPARYVGGEFNQPVLEPEPDLSVCLAYPDTYEVGMSYTGLLILYHLLNDTAGIRCERAFAPWPDMEAALRDSGTPLLSLESGTPLREFDLVGFSLQYDLCFTNILTMLDLGGIPRRREERGPRDAWIVGGGPCATNPEPLADYFDAFCIGDGEEVVLDIVRRLAKEEGKGRARREVEESLAGIEGVYVPSLYSPDYEDGGLCGIRGGERKVRRRIVDPETAYYPVKPLVPHITPIHDRCTLEPRRGCVRGCRFCQAGYITRPVRERFPGTLADQAGAMLRATGDDEIGLLALSIGDYSRIGHLASVLSHEFASSGVCLALPSLRADGFDPAVAKDAARVRRSSLTFAPEVGSEKMRRVINKFLGREDILAAVGSTSGAGFDLVKLYFMVGLPFEEMEDVEGIVELVAEVRAALGRGRKRINVAIAGFVPKAHTPFQWAAQLFRGELEDRMRYLKDRMQGRGVTVSYHDPRQSFLEAVFSRGDRRLGRVLERAHALGCRFDQWSETFEFDLWLRAFSDGGVSPDEFAARERGKDEVFPWDPVDTGVTREFLWKERERARECALTPDCTRGECFGCGVCGPEMKHLLAGEGEWQRNEALSRSQLSKEAVRELAEKVMEDEGPRLVRVRLEYSRRGPLTYVGHLDFQRSVQKLFRRAGVRVATSRGFHPHPKITFALPLPVGEEAGADLLDVELEIGQIDSAKLLYDLNRVAPPGLVFKSARILEPGEKKVTTLPEAVGYRVDVRAETEDGTGPDPEVLAKRWDELVRRENVPVTRKGKKGLQQVDLRPFLSGFEATTTGGGKLRLEFEFLLENGRTARAGEVLGLLCQGKEVDVEKVSREKILLRP